MVGPHELKRHNRVPVKNRNRASAAARCVLLVMETSCGVEARWLRCAQGASLFLCHRPGDTVWTTRDGGRHSMSQRAVGAAGAVGPGQRTQNPHKLPCKGGALTMNKGAPKTRKSCM